MSGNTPTHVGPFEVLRELGRGGMGVVYAARDPITGRQVAVKQILAQGASGDAIARFLREAETLGRVKHKGVVGVHQLGRTAAGPYIVEELIEGEPLSALVARGPLEPTLAARLARDVADAIAAVHALGTIHRDLKPANVMLRKDGSPVLLDFGLARDVNTERQLTKTGDVVGTVVYMAPEQADGRTRDLDERVDVYGLGAVLFELLAGAPPHQGAGFEVIVSILTKDPPRLRDRRPDVPPALDAVCAFAMVRDREQRYPSMRALRDDLGRFLDGETTEAEKRVTAGAPRGRRLMIAVAAGALAFALALGLFVAQRPPPTVTAITTEAAAVVTTPARTPTLWQLETVERRKLVYDLDLEERAVPEQRILLRARLRMSGEKVDAAGKLPFQCEVAALRCEVHTSLDVTFDSEAMNGANNSAELVPLGAAVERPFKCTIDVASGAVTIQGFQAISDAIKRQASSTTGVSPSLEEVLRRVFTDAFIGRSMHSLTCVRGSSVVVPWREGASGLTFDTEGEASQAALDSLISPAGGPAQRFRLAGQTRYEEGRVVEATLTQDPLPVDPRVSLTWSMRLSAKR